ncbi:hypothetical protein [Paludibaculum fermentans]|uniref:hypothetical protein n=1 Tax=Paludibaculum fermentans TaxID=1473598 RepID=UPI003EB9EAA6
MGSFRTVLPLFLLVSTALASTPANAAKEARATVSLDADRDGLDDDLEQALLEQFVPVLQLSAGECDGSPAEFRPGLPQPQLLARNGTLYGQSFPRTSPTVSGRLIELHYYHLWTRDCGRGGHALDAEHVSVLVRDQSTTTAREEWKALFWYAAAHEDTVCDFSSAAKAKDLEAEDRGATVWVSRGKHASFLHRGACTWGCGSDVCEGSKSWRASRVVNIGEAAALLNGAGWIRSTRWPMLEKLGIDFTEELMVSLSKRKDPGVMTLHVPLRTPQAVLLAGDSTADALVASGSKTGGALAAAGGSTDTAVMKSADKAWGALGTAGVKTGNAATKSTKATGRALRATFRETGRFLGINRK